MEGTISRFREGRTLLSHLKSAAAHVSIGSNNGRCRIATLAAGSHHSADISGIGGLSRSLDENCRGDYRPNCMNPQVESRVAITRPAHDTDMGTASGPIFSAHRFDILSR